MRTTHTYAELEVPADLYDLVALKLLEAGYHLCFEAGTRTLREDAAEATLDRGPIDMHGIALTRGPGVATAAHLADEAYRLFVEAFYPSWRRMMDGKAKFAVMRVGAQPITKADIDQARAENLDAPQLPEVAPDYKPTESLELCSADFLAQVETDLRRRSLSPGTRRFLEAGSALKVSTWPGKPIEQDGQPIGYTTAVEVQPDGSFLVSAVVTSPSATRLVDSLVSAERGDDDCRNGNAQPQANAGEGEARSAHLSGGEPRPGDDSGVRRPPTNPLPPVDFGAIVTKNL